MLNFLYALPILLVLFGMPTLIIIGLGIQWYRNYQNKKYKREHAVELEELEEVYGKIVELNKKMREGEKI